MCKKALNTFILYFVLCFEDLKRKKRIAVVVFKQKTESLDKNKNTFMNKNLQNIKMYIQKYRQSKIH